MVCPIRMMGKRDQHVTDHEDCRCISQMCGWWDTTYGQCGILAMAEVIRFQGPHGGIVIDCFTREG